MRIAIEAQRIFRADKHGMDFVILEVLKRLQRYDDPYEYFVFVAPGPDHCLHSSQRMQVIELHCPTYLLWEQWALPRAVRRIKADLLHCTSNTAPIHIDIPLILTLHDIIYLQTEKQKSMSIYQQMGWHYRRWNVPRIINKCHRIITVSETESRNIQQYFPQTTGKIKVIHNGYSDVYKPLANPYQITKKYLPDHEYLLFLGNTDPRKNTWGVLHAYALYLKQSDKKLKLVITGVSQKYVEKMISAAHLDICPSKLIYTGYVPGDELPALYSGAYAFLCPSLLEGFGIPILEAMACGVPVITSNRSSLPEVAGEKGILINPDVPQEIADAILKLENIASFRQKQIAYGLQRVKQFSWNQTAEQYRHLYFL